MASRHVSYTWHPWSMSMHGRASMIRDHETKSWGRKGCNGRSFQTIATGYSVPQRHDRIDSPAPMAGGEGSGGELLRTSWKEGVSQGVGFVRHQVHDGQGDVP